MLRRMRGKNGERGSASVEFAFAAVMLLTLLFSAIDLGRCLYAYHWVSYAARIGTRYAMLRGACNLPDGGACPYCTGSSLPCQASGDNITSYIQNYATGIDWSNVTVTPQCFVTGSAPNNPPCAIGKWTQVTVRYKFGFDTPFISNFVSPWYMASSSQRTVTY